MEKIRRSVTLNKLESGFYLSVWTIAVFYSIYNVYLANTYFDDYHDIYGDFSPGWQWLGRKRDTSDHEWKIWIPFIFNIFPWIFIHIVGSQVVKYYRYNDDVSVCIWYVVVAAGFLISYIGIPATLTMLTQPCISCLLQAIRIRIVSWIINLSCLVALNFMKQFGSSAQQWLGLQEEEYYMLLIAMCWIQLRSISYCIDSFDKSNLNDSDEFLKNLTFNVAYCLYLPTLFLGPFIMYKEFTDGVKLPYESWNMERIAKIVLDLSRYIFWLYFTEFSMHFLYFNALQYHPEHVRNLNPWAFYGLGYCMGQYFFNKYTVIYGIAGVIVHAERLTTIKLPKCIGRIHLYSDMWKYFDTGLYKFLMRYIYVPVSGTKQSSRKLIASLLCFVFVFIWHGTQLYIFVWSFLNFVGLTIERWARSIGKSKIFIEIQSRMLSLKNARRLNCALASPLLALSAVSNFYFFGGQDIGNIFILRIFSDSWGTVFSLMCILYCCCHASIDIQYIEMLQLSHMKIG